MGLDKHFRDKARHIVNRLAKHLPMGRFYIAGGCLAGHIRDVDVFPVSGQPKVKIVDATEICVTKNATTYRTKPWVLQSCSYSHPTLTSLVCSFDYAHIQVGAEIDDKTVARVFFTKEFVQARVTGTTWFVGSEYPLSSLIRSAKYHARNEMSKHHLIKSVIDSLVAIIERGFTNYEDFKDQLDAVDLGLLPEELGSVTEANLRRLFDLLKKSEDCEDE